MNKKILIPVLAFSIIGGGVAGSILNGSAFAANSTNNSDEEVSDQQEQKQLEKKASISKQEAISSALKKVAGKATETELENEDGLLVYGVKVKDSNGQVQEVKVDAKTGNVIKVEADDEKENEKGNKEEHEGYKEDHENDGEISDKEEQQQLEKEAKITKEDSQTIALEKVKGKVTHTELEEEDGVIIYSIAITDNQENKQEVKVDAKTGKVLKVERDDENGHENDDEE